MKAFIKERKEGTPTQIRDALQKKGWLDRPNSHVTSKQIHNWWSRYNGNRYYRDPNEFHSAVMLLGEKEGWRKLNMDREGVSLAFLTPFWDDPTVDIASGM